MNFRGCIISVSLYDGGDGDGQQNIIKSVLVRFKTDRSARPHKRARTFRVPGSKPPRKHPLLNSAQIRSANFRCRAPATIFRACWFPYGSVTHKSFNRIRATVVVRTAYILSVCIPREWVKLWCISVRDANIHCGVYRPCARACSYVAHHKRKVRHWIAIAKFYNTKYRNWNRHLSVSQSALSVMNGERYYHPPLFSFCATNVIVKMKIQKKTRGYSKFRERKKTGARYIKISIFFPRYLNCENINMNINIAK